MNIFSFFKNKIKSGFKREFDYTVDKWRPICPKCRRPGRVDFIDSMTGTKYWRYTHVKALIGSSIFHESKRIKDCYIPIEH